MLFWNYRREYRPAQASPTALSEPCPDSEEAGEEKQRSAASEASKDRKSGVDISSIKRMHVLTDQSLSVCPKGRRQYENKHGLSPGLNAHRCLNPRKDANLQVGRSALQLRKSQLLKITYSSRHASER